MTKKTVDLKNSHHQEIDTKIFLANSFANCSPGISSENSLMLQPLRWYGALWGSE